MRFLLISLLAVLLFNIVQAQEEFKGEKVTLGKKKCTCSFSLEADGDKCSGKGGCDKKCSGSGSVEIGIYSFTLKVKKGKATISKCKAEVEPTGTGTGSGEKPVTIPTTGGSGEEPVTMPPAPGSGSGPSPPMGEGMQCRCKCNCPDGSGECDCDCNCPMQSTAMTCASGFTRVCPMVEDACPEDMDMICPMNAVSRAAYDTPPEADGTGKGCQCVPDFLISLVSPMMPPAAVRLGAADREAVEASIKVGKTKCKCSFDMAVDGVSCKKSKGRCDKKCNGAAKGVELMDGMYMLDMKVKKGKVTIAKCEVTPITLTGTGTGTGTGSGTGSGGGAGGMEGMGSRCACVGKGIGGSGPPPPTGSGSGSGSEPPTGGPAPPTGGPAPPTGTGSGSGSADCQCGLAKRSTRIVGGVQTEVNEYPWQVGIVNKGSTSVWCGGSLISNRWILTAAHCTKGEEAKNIQALLGEHDYQSTSETTMVRMTISAIEEHNKYDHDTTDYDFSLLKMKTNVDFSQYAHIRPICLPVDDSNDYNDFIATVSGWGTLSSGGSVTNKLREVDVKVLTNSECKNNYGYSASWITAQMLCANVNGGGKDACQGDSGGPLVSSGSGDGVTAGQNYELIGVVSWGSGCADANYPGVYSRVTKELTWIASTTASGWSTCPRE